MKSKIRIGKNSKEWRLPNGELHREDGPAMEHNNGYKFWYINDLLHREDGPAVVHPSGSKSWYLNNINYTEQEHKFKMRDRKLKELLQ
jgi:hypothetical protein